MAIYAYTPLDAGSNSTLANGVNDLGQIVGSSGSFGFLYSGGVYTTLNVTGATGTQAYGINNSGNIVGSYSDGNGTHGFLYSGGTYQALNDPVATSGTNAFGINASGQIVGGYIDANGVHGFLDSGGIYTTLNVTGATGTQANGINDLGQIVGTYSNSTGTHGFLYSISTNTYVTVDDPAGTDGNWIQGINDNGQIVGYYSDSSGYHGFVESGSAFTSLDNPLAISTMASGIAMNGEIVGSYRDSSNSFHGWLTNPPAAQIFQVESLFVGYFGRVAAPSGEAYWLGRLDGIGGSAMTEAQIAASFSVQPEATNLYPFLANPLSATATQVASFVNSVFEDLFNRAPTYTSGHNFWVDQLLANLGNPQVIGESIVNIISGAQGNDITTLDQKVAVATYFTDHLAASGLAFGAAALTEAQGVIAATTSDPATVVTEEHNIDIFLASGGSSPNVQLVGVAADSAMHIAAA
jgi:probable HAF family extracellular repeat protein